MAYPKPVRVPENFLVSLPPVETRHFVVCPHGHRDGTVNYFGHQSLYRLYDESGRLLYVGIAWSIRRRFDRHRLREWWPSATRIRVQCLASREEARACEALAIRTEAPLHNIAGVPVAGRV